MRNKVKAILAAAEDCDALKPIGENGNYSLYDNALIGISYEGRLVYSIQKMIELYSKEYETSLEIAEEFLEYNCFGAYVGEMTPIYVRNN